MAEKQRLGETVRRLRDKADLSQEVLARKAKVTREWLSLVEGGKRKRPDRDMLERLAYALGVEPSSLLSLAQYRVTVLPPPPEPTAEDLLRQLQAKMRTTPIAVPKTSQPAAAGYGIMAEGETVPYLPAPGERNHYFIAVDVRGDCMEPELHDGETVIVDTDASPKPGKMVLAVHDSEPIIKELQERDGVLYLVAYRQRPPIQITEDTRILGVVKGAYRSL